MKFKQTSMEWNIHYMRRLPNCLNIDPYNNPNSDSSEYQSLSINNTISMKLEIIVIFI